MVQVFPFKAIRPEASVAEKVAELPYDVVNSQEAAAFAQGNPYSYFHIDRSEIDLPGIDPYDPQVYQKAAENLASFQEESYLLAHHSCSRVRSPLCSTFDCSCNVHVPTSFNYYSFTGN